MKPATPPPARLARAAAWLALPALAAIVWSIVDPRPIPVVVAMTLGQALGTVSLALLLWAIARDLGAARLLGRAVRDPPDGAPRPDG